MVEGRDGNIEMKELDEIETRRKLDKIEDLIIRSVGGVEGCCMRCSCDDEIRWR